jgi:predicted GNAT family acetyltransferase
VNVENDSGQHRFHVGLPEGEGELVYQLPAKGTIELVHTEVSPALRGRGVAEALAEAAFAYARANGMRVVPTCPYVKRWLTKHPEQRDLVAG